MSSDASEGDREDETTHEAQCLRPESLEARVFGVVGVESSVCQSPQRQRRRHF